MLMLNEELNDKEQNDLWKAVSLTEDLQRVALYSTSMNKKQYR